MAVPLINLDNNQRMPQVALGLWKNKDEQECVDTVQMAVKAGYRHFDTAQEYGNEQFLAKGLKKTGVSREDIFITTKIKVQNFIRVDKSFEQSLEKLETDYVDLLLLHFPVTGLRKNAWHKLEAIQRTGQAKNIGVSNYTIKHLEQMQSYASTKPAINQVELHVFLQQPELLEYCKKHNIMIEAYSPLAHGQGIDNPVLAAIAKKHKKTSAQIMLRWCIEAGTVPLPKSTHQERIEQNIGLFDFSLDAEDMIKIKSLEQGLRTCWDPTRVP